MNAQAGVAVKKYMRRLKRTLAGLPRAQRKEILAEIREHIDESLSQKQPESEQEVRAMLAQIGDPDEIASEARQRLEIPPAKFGWREIVALLLVPLGGLSPYAIGWFFGVILLWTSYAWTTREKLIGTLAPPFGLMPAIFLPHYNHSLAAAVIAGASLVLAIVVPIWLFVRARKRTRLTPRSENSGSVIDAAIEGAAGGSSR
jgi:HAAS domain-containing protein